MDLDRRHHRRGLRRRGRDRRRPTSTTSGCRRCSTGPTSSARSGCGPTPTRPATPSGRGRYGAERHRAVPDRAHVLRPRAAADRAAHDHGADAEPSGDEAIDALLPFQREDFAGLFRAMDGLPVIIRLLDPPLHEFLPGLRRADPHGRRPPDPARARGLDLTPVDSLVDELTGTRAMLRQVERPPRVQPDARPARRPARAQDPRPHPDAGPGDRRGRARGGSPRVGDPRPEIMVPLVSHADRARRASAKSSRTRSPTVIEETGSRRVRSRSAR